MIVKWIETHPWSLAWIAFVTTLHLVLDAVGLL
jgi:hypothetical protein